MIRHIVALRFDSAASGEVREAIFADLAALVEVIDGAVDFHVRKNISPETQVVHGFHDLFWFDFRDETARDAYLENATHKAIGGRLVAACVGGDKGITVLDFEL